MSHVTVALIAECAMRYDTSVARAFRTALGLKGKPPRGRSSRGPSNSRYDGASRLMAQRHGVRL